MKDIDEYQSLAHRTMKQEEIPKMMLHCIMGMAGEVGELREAMGPEGETIVGELGDCMWYSANLCQILGYKMTHLFQREVAGVGLGWSLIDQMMVASSRLIELAKKHEFYGKGYDLAELENYLAMYLHALVKLILSYELDVEYVAETNIKKLEKRYPDLRFDAMRAKNRDYAAESKAAGINIE